MVVVTLVCVILGGRIEYLRRMAAFHEREYDRIAIQLKAECGYELGKFQVPEERYMPRVYELSDHYFLARKYRENVIRPWTTFTFSPLSDQGKKASP